jgi:hypothetical protein
MPYDVYKGYDEADLEEKDVERAPWSREAAESTGTKLAIASGGEASSEKVSADLYALGQSEELHNTVSRLRQEDKHHKTAIAGEVASTLDAPTAVEVLEKRKTDSDDIELLNEASLYQYIAARHPDKLVDEESIFEMMEKEKALVGKAKDEYYESLELDDNAGSLILEFIEGVVPFVDAASVAKFEKSMEEATGQDFGSGVKSFFAPGTVLDNMARWIEDLPPQEQRQVAKWVVEKAQENSGILTDNDWIRVGIIHDTLSRTMEPVVEEGFDGNDLRNVISVLDVVALGQVVRNTANLGKTLKYGVKDASKESNVSQLDRIDPKAGAQARSEVIMDDSGVAAAKAGIKKEDAVQEAILSEIGARSSMPFMSKKFYERQMRTADIIANKRVDLSTYLTETEKVAQVNNRIASMERLGKGVRWDNASEVIHTEDGVIINSRFGKSSEEGYTSLEAVQAAERIKADVPANAQVRVVARDYDGTVIDPSEVSGGNLQPVKTRFMERYKVDVEDVDDIPLESPKKYDKWRQTLPAGKKPPLYKNLPKYIKDEAENPTPRFTEYFVDVRFVDDYKAGTHTVFNPDDVMLTGTKAKYIGDISAGFSKELSGQFYRAFDVVGGSKKAMIDMIQPFIRAKSKNRDLAVALLEKGRGKGASDGKTFTVDEIIGELDSISGKLTDTDIQQVVEGYISVRNLFDSTFVLNNRAFAARLDADGFTKVVEDGAGEVVDFVKTMSDEDISNITHAYNPTTKAVERLSPEDIARHLENNTQFVEARSVVKAGDQGTKVVMVDSKAALKARPEQVLNRIEGYVPRQYETDYFIVTRPTSFSMDGKSLSKDSMPITARMAVRNKSDLDEAIAEVQKQYPDLEVDYQLARELSAVDRKYMELDIEHTNGGLYFSKRGEQLQDFRNGIHELADTNDVVSGILKVAGDVARRIDFEPVLNLMERRFVERWGHLTKHQIPTEAKGIVHPTKGVTDEVQKARAAWDYMNMARRSGINAEWWKKSAFRFGEWVEDSTGNAAVGHYLRTKSRGRDPLSWMRGTTFLATIAFNPFRQLFVQSQQILFLSGISPTGVAASIRQAPWMIMAKTARAEGKDVSMSGLAKAAGLPEDEFVRMVEALEESGLVEGVDSHLLGMDAMFSIQREYKQGAGWLGQKVHNGFSKTAGFVKGMGFDAGERFNIVSSYAFAYREWKLANKGRDATTKAAKAEIHERARQLALGMTQVGAYGYQRGVLSLATQFLSIQHKAWASGVRWMTWVGGDKIGNKALTIAESRRIFMGQALLYGTSGWGIAEVVNNILADNNIVITDETQKHMLYGGLYDLTFNAALQAITGEETDLAAANSIAAGSGWTDTITRLFTELGGADKSVIEMFLGPTATLVYNKDGWANSRVGQAVNTIATLKGVMVNDDVELTPEQAREIALAFPRITSGATNLLRGMEGMKMKQWLDRHGQHLGIPSNTTEQAVAMLTGVQGYKQQAAFEVWETIEEKAKWVDDTAAEMYDAILREVDQASLPEVGREAELILLSEATTVFNVYKASLAPQDWDQVLMRYNQIVNQRAGTQDSLMDRASRFYLDNTYGYEDIIKSMMDMGLSEEHAQMLLDEKLTTSIFGEDE